MSQRNPMNERYQEEHLGKTRKSASSMKPKTKAASSVYIKPKEKTKEQKKAEKREARARQVELDRKYYHPPTAQYKKLRRLWVALLVGAVVFVALSFLGRSFMPEPAYIAILVLAYVCIIGALYVDFSKMRKARRAYQEEMESRKTKEQRALEKKQKAEAKAAKAEAAQKFEEAKAAEAEKAKKRGGLFGLFGGGGRRRDEDAAAEAAAEKDSQTSKK